MPDGHRSYEIFASTAVAASTTLTLLGSGSAGTLGAKRILTHPDAANFLPLVYDTHPKVTVGMDNEPLKNIKAIPVRTEGGTKVLRHPEFDTDVIITEIWPGGGKNLSMTSYFARRLYEICANPPAFSASAQTFITWEPRDRNAKTYNVVIIGFSIGGDDGGINFSEARGTEGNEIRGALEGLDVSPTGAVIEAVTMRFKIVGEAE